MKRRKRGTIPTLYVPYAFLGFGLLWILIAGAFAYYPARLLMSGERTEGVVTRLKVNESGRYAPVFQFELPTGRLITVESSTASRPPSFQVDEQVEILYYPEAPENARINKWIELWLLPLLTSLFGLIFGGIGLFSLFSFRRQRRRSADGTVSLQKKISPKFLPYVFLGFGLFWFLIAGIIITIQQRYNERAVRTEGMVVRTVQAESNSQSPIVRFRLPDGETVEFRSAISSTNPQFEVEEKVEVRYDPEDPYNAQIVSWMEGWFAAVLMAGFGTIFSIVGIILFFALKK